MHRLEKKYQRLPGCILAVLPIFKKCLLPLGHGQLIPWMADFWMLNVNVNAQPSAQLLDSINKGIPMNQNMGNTASIQRGSLCITPNGIWAVLRIPKHDILLDFSRYRENRFEWVFCDLFQILMIKYDPAGVTWPWVPGEAKEFMVRFFWDWVYKRGRVVMCE